MTDKEYVCSVFPGAYLTPLPVTDVNWVYIFSGAPGNESLLGMGSADIAWERAAIRVQKLCQSRLED